ncbi:fimbrial protein [Escherichia albertii]|nr:fimbrial protein [Escherichia albertii]
MNPPLFAQLKHWRRMMLVLLFCCPYSLHAANTLVVGSKTTVDGGGTTKNRGPSADGNATSMFTAGANQIVIAHSGGLQYSNLKLQLQADTAGNGNTGAIYCAPGGMGGPITLESHFVKAPYSYGGHQLFKTNMTGLYFTMRMYNIYSYATTSTDDIYIGDAAQQSLNLRSTSCASSLGWYLQLGGIVANIDISFYNDATFDPDATGSISLLSDTSYHYSLKNLSPGGGLVTHTIYQSYNLANITLSTPTCSSAILAGNTVSKGDTVALGEYSPKEIIDGVAGIPFAINLQNCYRVTNVELKMTTGAPAMSATLLGNSLTANAANGVGVEIKGQSNSHYAEVTLIPNDANSVYKDYVNTADTSNGIIGSGASGTAANQTLNFVATLKQDNNQQIRGGDFKATAVFSITYP